MYVFLLFFPLLYSLLLHTIGVVSLPAKAHIQLFGTISILHVPIAPIAILLLRFFIAKAYTLFTPVYIVLYTLVALLPYLHALFYMHAILRRTSFWTQECMLITICTLEFWFALGTLLIASHHFTYREYFLYPVLRMSSIITYTLGVISGRAYTYALAAFFMVLIGITATFLSIYAYPVQAFALVLVVLCLHAMLVFHYALSSRRKVPV